MVVELVSGLPAIAIVKASGSTRTGADATARPRRAGIRGHPAASAIAGRFKSGRAGPTTSSARR
jgi:hypothetical protein